MRLKLSKQQRTCCGRQQQACETNLKQLQEVMDENKTIAKVWRINLCQSAWRHYLKGLKKNVAHWIRVEPPHAYVHLPLGQRCSTTRRAADSKRHPLTCMAFSCFTSFDQIWLFTECGLNIFLFPQMMFFMTLISCIIRGSSSFSSTPSCSLRKNTFPEEKSRLLFFLSTSWGQHWTVQVASNALKIMFCSHDYQAFLVPEKTRSRPRAFRQGGFLVSLSICCLASRHKWREKNKSTGVKNSWQDGVVCGTMQIF